MKSRYLGIVLVVLVAANIITLGVFWYYKIHNIKLSEAGNTQGNGNASSFIIKQVGFTASQQARYLELVRQHQQRVRDIRDQLHIAKDSFFDELSDTTVSAATIDAASSTIGKLEKDLDVQTFNHFKQVRAMCTPEQKIKMDNCIKQVMRMMGPPPPGGRPQGPPDAEGGPGGGMPPPQGDRLPPPPPQQ
ncbi:periplasmic heavy metal sensor [Mucilaginibacter sp. HMF5004]|uniref:Spy/CpxP family protein refolding chaperone n=1 Tax=Mucilaginibacter rivuli TaxID=2857527 RepID=UPI001C5CE645|nr:periplasmic heavy metal sensor [Mucilaginibacter rivuli]MBW4889607.1 periplasmic heavy metal sensor [Mucilaginibacter rivuli]